MKREDKMLYSFLCIVALSILLSSWVYPTYVKQKRHIDHKYGYIDKTGNFVLEPKFIFAESFSEGLAIVNYTSYITKTGEVIFKSDYLGKLEHFSDGVGVACIGPSANNLIIDKRGNSINVNLKNYDFSDSEYRYMFTVYRVQSFSEGLAVMVAGLSAFPKGEGEEKGGKVCVFIDKKGDIAIGASFADARNFSEGLAAVLAEEWRWGYIDKSFRPFVRNYRIPPRFREALNFHDGIAQVCDSYPKQRKYIDKNGNYIKNGFSFGSSCDEQYDFREGMALIEDHGKFGYINMNGDVVINPQFKKADKFYEGLARVELKKRWGYIDKTGAMVIQPQFVEAASFSEGLAVVKIGEVYGFIDKTGKLVTKFPKTMRPFSFSDGLALVEVEQP